MSAYRLYTVSGSSCTVEGCVIEEDAARLRCTSCEAVVCLECGARCAACPSCGGQLFRDKASAQQLSAEVADRGSTLEACFEVYAARPCLRAASQKRFMSYGEVAAAAKRMGQAAASYGGAVAICAKNSVEWLLCDWGCAMAGVPTIACDPRRRPDETLRSVRDAAAAVGLAIGCVVADDDAAQFLGALSLGELAAMPSRQPCKTQASWSTCMFTSGTSGDPKPLWFDAWPARAPSGCFETSRCAVFAPLHHSLGRRQAWRELWYGGSIVVVETPRDDVLAALVVANPTSLAAVPHFYSSLLMRGLYARLLREGDAESAKAALRAMFPRLRFVAVSGAACDPDVLDFLRDVFGCVADSYGTTEMGGILSGGLPVAGVTVDLRPVDGWRGAGEIVVRGETRRPARGAAVDDDGWYHTGDVGAWDEEGRIRVVGRLGSGIKLSNGEFASPETLERLVEKRCPRVVECAVLVSPGDDAPTCVVVVGTIARDVVDDVTRLFVETTGAAPRDVVVTSEAFTAENGRRTAVGKLSRRPPLFDRLRRALFSAAEHEFSPRSTLAECGLDSVGIARLAQVERDALRRGGLRPADLFAATLGELRHRMSSPQQQSDVFSWSDEIDEIDRLRPLEGPRQDHETATSTAVLVGAVGFLGPELERALLATDRFQRLVSLSRHHRQPSSERILAVNFDLEESDLGLSLRDRLRLETMRVDLVVLAAARVDHLRGYEELKAANVSGVDRLVDLFARQAPRFCFVSSTAATRSLDEAIVDRESTPPKTAYGATKWVAERRLKRRAGRLVVARLGMLGPPTCGAPRCNHRDWIHLFCRAVLATGSIPNADDSQLLSVLPVDLAADAVVDLALLDDSFLVAHLDADALGLAPPTWGRFLDFLSSAALDAGAPALKRVPYSDWRALVLALDGDDQVASTILALLPPPDDDASSLRFPTT